MMARQDSSSLSSILSSRITTLAVMVSMIGSILSLDGHSMTSAFVPSVSTRRSRQAFGITPAPGTTEQKGPRIEPLTTSLQVVADFAEQDELKRRRNNRDDDDDDDDENNTDDAWIPTESGGFLPNLRRQKRRSTPSIVKRVAKRARPLPQVTTLQEYKEAVVDDDDDRLVCVRFYAPWCRACKAVGAAFYRLADQYKDRVKFVEVPLTKENGFLLQGLGIPSLPFSHIYHPQVGLVEELRINKKLFPEFARILKTYADGECSVDEWEEKQSNDAQKQK